MSRAPISKTHEGTITVGSIYGFKADMPMIEIEMTGFKEPKAQLTLTQAREIVQHLQEAIEAAQADGFIVRYFRDTMELTEGQLGALLQQFRASRATMDRPGGTKRSTQA